MIKKYEILSAFRGSELAREVQSLINQGYQPRGEVIVRGDYICQVMILSELPAPVPAPAESLLGVI